MSPPLAGGPGNTDSDTRILCVLRIWVASRACRLSVGRGCARFADVETGRASIGSACPRRLYSRSTGIRAPRHARYFG